MIEQKIIRWGVAGTGTIARQFAGDIRHARGASLAAVCARDPAKAEDFAGRRSGVAAFGSLAEMIASNAVDAIYIATPNTAHRVQALECIAAGMPVLVEKPMTADLDQALEIVTAARTAGSFVMEAMWSRYLPAIKAARSAVRAGAIGEVRRLRADIAWKHDFDPASRLFDRSQGGGALHDLGVYPISLARCFLGDPDHVEGTWRAAPSGVDMAATIRLRFGASEAVIECGFNRDGSNRMLIEGDSGVLALGSPFIKADGFVIFPSRFLADLLQPGGQSTAARLRRKLFARMPLPGVTRQRFGFDGGGLQFEIEAASNAIRQGLREEPDNRLDDTIAALRIIGTILAGPPEPD